MAMADTDVDFTTSQILSNVEDLDVSNAYCLYQRRYPRRLPKLDDYPKKSSKQPSPKHRKLRSAAPRVTPEEAMPLNKDNFFEKREGSKDSVHEDIKSISLEDFEDDFDREVVFQKPTSTKNVVSFHIEADARKPLQSPRRTSPPGGVNGVRPNSSVNTLRNVIPVHTLRNLSPRAKSSGSKPRSQSVFERSSKQRSPSVFEQSSTRGGRLSPSVPSQKPIVRTCFKSSPKSSPRKGSLEFVPQKEISIHSILKNKRSVSKVPSTKRRHTCGNFKSRDVNLIDVDKSPVDIEVRLLDTQQELEDKKVELEPLPVICKTPVVVKDIDKASREYFFGNTLESDKQMEWLEDIAYEAPEGLVPEAPSKECLLKGELISYKVAYTLRMLLFGSCLVSFTSSWREQTLSYFQPDHYSLKFHKDGPIEVMVPLQAYVLKNLLFQTREEFNFDSNKKLFPSRSMQHQVLLTSLCDMIWMVGEGKSGVIALPNGECQFIPDYCYKTDEITEKMELFKFMERKDLDLFMKQNIHKFQEIGNYGCISLLYSLMLTRGLSKLFEDCSEMKHGVLETDCSSERSQSLINLCIYGEAVPNTFNHEKEVFIESLNKIEIRKGVGRRCEIGYLTHTEYVDTKLYEVGSCLKTPRYPIWVTNNNGTLSVLFSTKRDLLCDWKLERRFDLYLFQGIPRYVITSEIDIRLTIDTMQKLVMDEEEEISTLEETVRTKWTDSVIEWNGYSRF